MAKAVCSLCDGIMESTHRHDFVRCPCGKSFLDGGDDYHRGTMTTIMLNGDEESETK
jgi:hypothetical protein